MPVLIDGNNLLHAALDHDPERPPSRSTLCRILALWSRRTGEKVTIVFDGRAPAAALAKQISVPGVEVHYSGRGIEADETLECLINESTAARLLSVVSSDHEVMRAARRRRAKTCRADDFWESVLRDLARPLHEPLEPPEKQTGITPEQADDWLRTLEGPEE